MPKWPWRAEQTDGSQTDTTVAQLAREEPIPVTDAVRGGVPGVGAGVIAPVTLRRVAEALEQLEIRYRTDGDGSLLALWERHAVLLSGAHPELIAELVDCAAVVAMGFVDWLHDEGALL